MKKIIFLISIAFSFAANSQTLDTVRVRNLTLQSQDWAWIGSHMNGNDSVNLLAMRIVRAKIQSNIPASWTTNVTVDSIPGSSVVDMYKMVLTANAGEIAARYSAIKSAIEAKTVLTQWLTPIETVISNDFINRRKIGKNKFID